MENFTPASALAGGVLIGASAALLLLMNGRIAGISNIAAGLWGFTRGDWLWRLLFLVSMVAAVAVYYAVIGNASVPRSHFPIWLLGLGGLLVGYGTSLGSGCTSGHGVCGLGRLSLRSLAAVLVFLGTGICTVFVVRHLFGVY